MITGKDSNLSPDLIQQVFKVIFIGTQTSGKSEVIEAIMAYDNPDYIAPPTPGASTNRSAINTEFKRKTVNIIGKNISFNLWDNVSSKNHKNVTANFLRGSHAAVMVIDCRQPWDERFLDNWMPVVEEYTNTEVLVYLMCNHFDEKGDKKKSELVKVAASQAKKKHGFKEVFYVGLAWL